MITSKLKKEQKLILKEAKFNPQNFGNSKFINSKNYVRLVDKKKAEAICNVTHTIDLLNSEGSIVTKGIENNIMIKLTFLKNKGEQFLVNKIEVIKSN